MKFSFLFFMLVNIIVSWFLIPKISKLCIVFCIQVYGEFYNTSCLFASKQDVSHLLSVWFFYARLVVVNLLSSELTRKPLANLLASTAVPSILLLKDGGRNLIALQIRSSCNSPASLRDILLQEHNARIWRSRKLILMLRHIPFYKRLEIRVNRNSSLNEMMMQPHKVQNTGRIEINDVQRRWRELCKNLAGWCDGEY